MIVVTAWFFTLKTKFLQQKKHAVCVLFLYAFCLFHFHLFHNDAFFTALCCTHATLDALVIIDGEGALDHAGDCANGAGSSTK